MELSVVKSLLMHGVDRSLPAQHWADLGAGTGLFTNALADLLPANSAITALDRDQSSLQKITLKKLAVSLQTVVANLNELPQNLGPFDGIVMANALHYITHQNEFLLRLKTDFLKNTGVLILVEYNLEKANPWVPHPISKTRLLQLSEEAGFDLKIFPDSVKSKLNSSEIYSAALKPKA